MPSLGVDSSAIPLYGIQLLREQKETAYLKGIAGNALHQTADRRSKKKPPWKGGFCITM